MTGTVPVTGSIVVEVTFFCTEPGDYTGTLEILHSDPCREPVDVPLLMQCRTTIPVFLPVLLKNY